MKLSEIGALFTRFHATTSSGDEHTLAFDKTGIKDAILKSKGSFDAHIEMLQQLEKEWLWLHSEKHGFARTTCLPLPEPTTSADGWVRFTARSRAEYDLVKLEALISIAHTVRFELSAK